MRHFHKLNSTEKCPKNGVDGLTPTYTKEKILFWVGFQNNSGINARKSTYKFIQHPFRAHGLAREPLTAWHARATNFPNLPCCRTKSARTYGAFVPELPPTTD